METVAEAMEVSCAVEVFLATALLHRENPGRPEFSIREIVNRAARENITGELRSGVQVHASQHCVANKAPNPARHKMIYATGKHTRRLLEAGDEIHPARTGKIFPDAGEIPERYLPLLEWARKRYEQGNARLANSNASDSAARESSGSAKTSDKDPATAERWLESLFELEGLGKEHWKEVDPDKFVRELREGWE